MPYLLSLYPSQSLGRYCNPKEQTTVQKLTSKQMTKKPTAQNGTFGFPRHTSQSSKNQKSHFFAHTLTPFRLKNLS